MMLDNSTYNKTKLLYKASELLWFIDKHAIADAQLAGDSQTAVLLDDIRRDLQKHIAKLQTNLCLITQ